VPTDESAAVPQATTKSRVVGAIPARFGSSRLPGKPLRQLAGRSLIEHVFRQATQAAELDQVVVLTDDQRIFEAVSRFEGNVEMTPTECASGTDRVAAAARHWPVTAVVNIQGDEPLIDPQAIDTLARHLKQNPNDPMVTLAAPAKPGDRDNPDVVKVVVDLSGTALYFSRSPIPYRRGSEPHADLRHIGIYGYQLQTLLDLADLPASALERSESLEQLRALENGIGIKVLEVARGWQGVDTMEDLERVESILKAAASSTG